MTVKEISDVSNLSAGAVELVREDSTPSTYVDSLEKQELYQDAIHFMAHKMAVNAAIKWSAACIRELQSPEDKEKKDAPLDAVEQWIQAPADPTRWHAKETADKVTDTGASFLSAMAVYMSGGSLSPPGAPETPPTPHAAQKFAAGSIIVAVVSHDPENAADRYKRALNLAKTFDL